MIILFSAFLLTFLNLQIASAIEYNPICLNKSLKIEASLDEQQRSISIVFKDKLSNIKIQSVNGIDGLEVFNHEIIEESLNQRYLISINYSQPDGESFIVVSVSYDEVVQGVYVNRKEVVTIAVGEPSEAQKRERMKRINFIKAGYYEVDENGQTNTEKLRVHEFRLIEKK